jgi:GT2 family glycosyltransferase/lipopolysaccharide/colanic/teichoic acid biosynthesis glycosyltransferase
MQLSIITVNYNVRLFLEHALVSLQKATRGIDAEIIVVDNASDDGSVEMVRAKFPTVRLFINENNLGFAKANNIAMKQAKGDYILLLNPDTLVQEDTLHTMMAFFEQHSDVGLAGCKILNPDGSLQLACRRSFPTPWVAFTKITGLSALFPYSKLFGRYNLTYLNPDESHEVDAVSGSFMFLRREVYEQVGGLDEQFFMYGEDLDWCYRIQQAGWKVYYVPTTQIIHYKGESVKRSNIDELKLFYDAMHLFVKKHMRRPSLAHGVLRIGIVMRSWVAFFSKTLKPLAMMLTDWILIVLSFGIGSYIHLQRFFDFPDYAFPVLFLVPGAIITTIMLSLEVYTHHPYNIRRTAVSVLLGYVVISALTFFFKDYAFSRMMVIYATLVSLITLPGWRVLIRLFSYSLGREGGVFGRRTLIVGTEEAGFEVLRKLRNRIDNGYNVVGFIDTHSARIGEKIGGVEILGSIDNIGKVIRERKITDVIFSTHTLSYTEILSVIGKSRERSVNFRLVPSTLEVIIGKTSIDRLDDIPLVEIDYNIDRPMNKFTKRIFDIVVSSLLLITAYPITKLTNASKNQQRLTAQMILMSPRVFSGELSLVGQPLDLPRSLTHSLNGKSQGVFLGKRGITGLAQLHRQEELTNDEIENYILYYAKNQSIMLDLEILLKSFLLAWKTQGQS